MTDKDLMMEGWERLPPTSLQEAQQRLVAAEEALESADEG